MTTPKTPPLQYLYFYITDGCNLRCRHCWLDPALPSSGKSHLLSLKAFQTAIEEALPLGIRSVKLTGGEPLLHPRILDFLEFVRSRELTITLETNGTLLSPAMARELAKNPKRFVSLSIDGTDAQTHDWIRGVPGSFDKACQAVRLLAETGTPPQMILSIMNRNRGQVEAYVEMAEALGAASVKFNVVQPTARGQALHEDHLTLGVRDLIELGGFVQEEVSKRANIPVYFDCPMAFRSLQRILSPNGCSVCGVFGILGVIASGKYALCGIGNHIPELTFGTIGEDRLDTVWSQSPFLLSLRESLPGRLEGICSRCLMKWRCLGACIAQNYYSSGNPWAPYWFCEQARKEGLFPENRLM
jgi:SynChlorMet cassette radical SAM/SPASM protein ScmF